MTIRDEIKRLFLLRRPEYPPDSLVLDTWEREVAGMDGVTLEQISEGVTAVGNSDCALHIAQLKKAILDIRHRRDEEARLQQRDMPRWKDIPAENLKLITEVIIPTDKRQPRDEIEAARKKILEFIHRVAAMSTGELREDWIREGLYFRDEWHGGSKA